MTLEPTMYMNDITENTSGVTFLLPFIKCTSHRSTVNKSMGRILTDLTENGKKDYRDYRVPSLPVGCNGSSFRAGVVNTLLPFMPEYMVSIATGHDGGKVINDISICMTMCAVRGLISFLQEIYWVEMIHFHLVKMVCLENQRVFHIYQYRYRKK